MRRKNTIIDQGAVNDLGEAIEAVMQDKHQLMGLDKDASSLDTQLAQIVVVSDDLVLQQECLRRVQEYLDHLVNKKLHLIEDL